MKEQDLITISIESDVKAIVEDIFSQLGMTKSQAIELFYQQVALTKNIPFKTINLNEETIGAIEELNDKENLNSYNTFAELRQELGV
ncbi:MAG TPA: type II toxin-antitoxin system antitoxin, RelB/DinJ family [Cyanobacteria bacterium UBA11149]|nr:type II toxin-antitoxin system antitoxin, RelB/DinJ family [Cyanobacteria bacterium UBA11366]HBK64542.1 type II toxin-antitoxin system antitoxin, RelB/DinJ family [Cyanobacteria bacterium UBA11166]HBR77020.1 type II toxin-antitoxin system antitoxin, RelB/DinJ family [Cyanobacteria bacterium UBA11159]HBS70981.1 type II toxin-antitoxin system antitoxin, RelB/DinJ family [Cyanobacteria bacterium UBA11153]HBW87941.1 type II toxin-antitoxin system antitoxin, RelB/DinJ family [Cyanobacteria bacter